MSMTLNSDVIAPGEPAVNIRLYRPIDVPGALPCIVSMHSGGFVSGDLATDEQVHAELCRELGVVVAAVEYRLAPDTTYPGPITDCYTALSWLYLKAEELGVDRDRIGVHGSGAGGGLAAALALVARDHRDIPLAFQVLESPMLDDRVEQCEAGWRAYLGDLYGTAEIPIYAAPARSSNLKRLPPAFVSVAEFATARAQIVDYAARLDGAGVSTELRVVAAGDERAPLEWLRRLLEP